MTSNIAFWLIAVGLIGVIIGVIGQIIVLRIRKRKSFQESYIALHGAGIDIDDRVIKHLSEMVKDIDNEKQSLSERAREYEQNGLTLRKRSVFDLAAEVFHKALEINRKLNDKPAMAMNLENLGICFLAIGELEQVSLKNT